MADSSGVGRPPLPTLLSQVLVAFVVEFDNEAEHRMQHRTATGARRGADHGPWLTSMVMWSNFLRFVGDDGVPLAEVSGLAGITNLGGMRRWGYVEVDAGDVVRLKRGGRHARDVWAPLTAEIETRWRERYGAGEMDGLGQALRGLAGRVGDGLPLGMPVVGFGNGMRVRMGEGVGGRVAVEELDLAALLTRVLLAFTCEFEEESRLSLTMGADVLRVLDGEGVRVRDVPLLGGVSKEGVASALGFLERHDLATTGPDPDAARTRVVRLTEQGLRAQRRHHDLVREVEARWRERFGAAEIDALRSLLQGVIGPRTCAGLEPYPEGWRAQRPYRRWTDAVLADPAAALPHHPMVLHRGGFPDGS